MTVRATAADGTSKEFRRTVRIDTPVELDYYRNGGILQTVLRKLLKERRRHFNLELHMGQLKWCCAVFVCVLSFHSAFGARWPNFASPVGTSRIYSTPRTIPNVELDEDFTPNRRRSGPRSGSRSSSTTSPRSIRKMNGGHGPDVLGLAEIENPQGRRDAARRSSAIGTQVRNRRTKIRPATAASTRRSFTTPRCSSSADSKFHFVDAEKTRDILEAKLRRVGSGEDAPSALRVREPLAVAQQRPSGSGSWRLTCCESGSTRSSPPTPRPTSCWSATSTTSPTTRPSPRFLPARRRPRESPTTVRLYDTTAPIAIAGKGTFVFDDKWNMLDHIVISPGLLDGEGFAWRTGSSKLLDFPELFSPEARPPEFTRPCRRAELFVRRVQPGRLFRPYRGFCVVED